MHQFLLLRRRLSLIVCMAMMLNLFAPARGQAMDGYLPDPLAMEVCSAAGTKPQQVPIAGHAMKHCALCASHGASGAGAPPPAAGMLPAVVLLARGAAALPPARAIPLSWQAWSPAQPRAPPW